MTDVAQLFEELDRLRDSALDGAAGGKQENTRLLDVLFEKFTGNLDAVLESWHQRMAALESQLMAIKTTKGNNIDSEVLHTRRGVSHEDYGRKNINNNAHAVAVENKKYCNHRDGLVRRATTRSTAAEQASQPNQHSHQTQNFLFYESAFGGQHEGQRQVQGPSSTLVVRRDSSENPRSSFPQQPPRFRTRSTGISRPAFHFAAATESSRSRRETIAEEVAKVATVESRPPPAQARPTNRMLKPSYSCPGPPSISATASRISPIAGLGDGQPQHDPAPGCSSGEMGRQPKEIRTFAAATYNRPTFISEVFRPPARSWLPPEQLPMNNFLTARMDRVRDDRKILRQRSRSIQDRCKNLLRLEPHLQHVHVHGTDRGRDTYGAETLGCLPAEQQDVEQLRIKHELIYAEEVRQKREYTKKMRRLQETFCSPSTKASGASGRGSTSTSSSTSTDATKLKKMPQPFAFTGLQQFDAAFARLHESFGIRMDAVRAALHHAKTTAASVKHDERKVLQKIDAALTKAAEMATKKYLACPQIYEKIHLREELKYQLQAKQFEKSKEMLNTTTRGGSTSSPTSKNDRTSIMSGDFFFGKSQKFQEQLHQEVDQGEEADAHAEMLTLQKLARDILHFCENTTQEVGRAITWGGLPYVEVLLLEYM
ncbi:unnamed protein product [Amoebophrya sp. A120]|nr:unnamed protein product [Amoebophrya sp. A120]|eukprot:GSA120T00006430001.1